MQRPHGALGTTKSRPPPFAREPPRRRMVTRNALKMDMARFCSAQSYSRNQTAVGSLPREVFMRETWVRVRQHMVIGFLFIMPVLITVAVLGRFWKDMLRVGGAFAVLLRVGTILGP